MQAVPFLSTGFQAASAMYDGLSQSAALKSQAAVDKDNANSDLLQSALQAADIRRRGRAVQGEAIAALADGGGDVSGTSAQDLIFQNSLEIEYAASNAKYGGATAARGDLMAADEKRRAARSAVIGGVMRAGAAAITGAATARNSQAADAAYRERYNAYFPGGQRLPMPPSYGGN
jgi:autotransporter translocation and assembly factor TamB